jgi:hypothetical protein
VHVALVAPHYYVGSFDDDASYILTAKALLSGQGLNGHLASGAVISGLYPPGYSAVLVPLVWAWPHSFVPLRLLSVACYAALFPLTWLYLGRRSIGYGIRVATLTVLALAPPLATFASMVMAETPFLVVLLVLLILADRWDQEARAWTATGVGVVLMAGALVWLKQAGVGLVIGLALSLALRRHPERLARFLMFVLGVAALLAPVVAARLIAGIPIAGSHYSMELGVYYQGGLVNRLSQVLPHSGWHLLSTAIPATLVPYLDPLPLTAGWAGLWVVLSWQVTILSAVGAVAWWRRHRDLVPLMVAVYLFQSVLWPKVNERRVILVIPILAAWYVLGATAAWQSVARRARGRGSVPDRTRLAAVRAVAGAFVVGAVLAPLAAQAPRDYLFGWNQSGSHFQGSRYAAMLARLGTPAEVVETDYSSSTALFTGHRTNYSAFLATQVLCLEPSISQAIAADGAAFLLLGDVNKRHLMDSPCLLSEAEAGSWAVPLLHTTRDDAYVFELLGPGTGHPRLANLDATAVPAQSAQQGSEVVEYNWPRPATVQQVSVGQAAMSAGPTGFVDLEIRRPNGAWAVVARAPAAVGDGRGSTPFLLATFPEGVVATGVRVVVGPGTSGAAASVSDVAAFGPSAATT